MGDKNHLVVVPDSIAGRQGLSPNGLYSRQKLLIYKNKDNGTVILLSITANNKNTSGREWKHAAGYEPSFFNAQEGKFAESYNDIFSKAEVYNYSFDGSGYNISLIGISDNPKKESAFTLTQVAMFSDKLVKFLDSKGIK